MKVFSKSSKHNKSTPLLHSLTAHIVPKTTQPPARPKGITKVTSYKNKFAQSTNQHTNAVLPQTTNNQQQILPKTERSVIQTSHIWRTEASVELEDRRPHIPNVPALLSSVKYKSCKSEKN